MISSQTTKILIIDDFHPVLLEELKQAGLDAEYLPGFNPSGDMSLLQEIDIVVLRSKLELDAAILSSLPGLKCIARGGAGMDNIDEAFALKQGIELLNAPEGNRDAVAEHTLGLLLNLSKNISRSYDEVRDFRWNREKNRGFEIGGKTIGIIGFGNTGSCFAAKLSGLNCKVLAYDKYIDIRSVFAQQSTLEEILQKADVISFHIPLNPETEGIINSRLIAEMKEGIVLINTSRGRICKLQDIAKGIKSGKIKAFASDVLENENFPSLNTTERNLLQELMSGNQVIITPHIAGWTHESYYRIAKVLSEKILAFTTKVKNIRMNVDL